MSLTKKDCAMLRVVINRALLGPAWFNDEPSTPQLRAMVAELRHQTREWLMANVVRELQAVLPTDERVNLRGIQAAAHAVPAHGHATQSAAPEAPESAAGQTDDSAHCQATPQPDHLAPAEHTVQLPECAPLALEHGRNRLGQPQQTEECPWCLRHVDDCRCPDSPQPESAPPAPAGSGTHLTREGVPERSAERIAMVRRCNAHWCTYPICCTVGAPFPDGCPFPSP